MRLMIQSLGMCNLCFSQLPETALKHELGVAQGMPCNARHTRAEFLGNGHETARSDFGSSLLATWTGKRSIGVSLGRGEKSGARVVRKVATIHGMAGFGVYWHCAGTSFVLRWHYTGAAKVVLVLYWCFPGTKQVLHKNCTGTRTRLSSYYTGTALTLRWHSTGNRAMLPLCCTRTRLIPLHWYCNGTTLALYRYCTDTSLVVQRHRNLNAIPMQRGGPPPSTRSPGAPPRRRPGASQHTGQTRRKSLHVSPLQSLAKCKDCASAMRGHAVKKPKTTKRNAIMAGAQSDRPRRPT